MLRNTSQVFIPNCFLLFSGGGGGWEEAKSVIAQIWHFLGCLPFKCQLKHFFFTAMALEQLQSAGELEISDDDIISCYECAGDIGLWLVTDQTTSQRLAVTSQTMSLGRTLEIALQRAPVLLIKNG